MVTSFYLNLAMLPLFAPVSGIGELPSCLALLEPPHQVPIQFPSRCVIWSRGQVGGLQIHEQAEIPSKLPPESSICTKATMAGSSPFAAAPVSFIMLTKTKVPPSFGRLSRSLYVIATVWPFFKVSIFL
jgi:hypothetical protein